MGSRTARRPRTRVLSLTGLVAVVVALTGSTCHKEIVVSGGLTDDVDNVAILIRHGRNLDFRPWNLVIGQQDKLCSNLSEWADAGKWGRRFCGSASEEDTLIYYLEPERERDLAIGENPTTDRFLNSANAIRVGLIPQGSCDFPPSQAGRSEVNEFPLPAASSRQSLLEWWREKLPEQDGRLRDLKDLFDNTQHPVTVFVLSRSIIYELTDLLDDDGSDVAQRFSTTIAGHYEGNEQEWFYKNYWVVERQGSRWIRARTVPITDDFDPEIVRCDDLEQVTH